MIAAKAVLVLVLTGILAGASLGFLHPPEWVQVLLTLAIVTAVR
jgi:hypothetical protein